MSTVTPTRSARLDVRLRKDQKATIEEAAAQLGQSLSEFAVSVLLERSREVIEQHQRTALTNRDRDLFLEMLDNDKPDPALRKAARIYKRQVRGR
jgi:uncharacterized protein (DUF1778 family)